MCSVLAIGAMIYGGFENNSPPDIYKRWVAFGLLSSHSRLHGLALIECLGTMTRKPAMY